MTKHIVFLAQRLMQATYMKLDENTTLIQTTFNDFIGLNPIIRDKRKLNIEIIDKYRLQLEKKLHIGIISCVLIHNDNHENILAAAGIVADVPKLYIIKGKHRYEAMKLIPNVKITYTVTKCLSESNCEDLINNINPNNTIISGNVDQIPENAFLGNTINKVFSCMKNMELKYDVKNLDEFKAALKVYLRTRWEKSISPNVGCKWSNFHMDKFMDFYMKFVTEKMSVKDIIYIIEHDNYSYSKHYSKVENCKPVDYELAVQKGFFLTLYYKNTEISLYTIETLKLKLQLWKKQTDGFTSKCKLCKCNLLFIECCLKKLDVEGDIEQNIITCNKCL